MRRFGYRFRHWALSVALARAGALLALAALAACAVYEPAPAGYAYYPAGPYYAYGGPYSYDYGPYYGGDVVLGGWHGGRWR